MLNASRGSVMPQVEKAFMACALPITKRKIFQIAAELNVPLKLTRRCVTTGRCPAFVVNLASLGELEGESGGGANSPFTRWRPIRDQPGTLSARKPTSADWVDHITTRVTFKEDSKPTFRDEDIYNRKGSNSRQGWLRYALHVACILCRVDYAF